MMESLRTERLSAISSLLMTLQLVFMSDVATDHTLPQCPYPMQWKGRGSGRVSSSFPRVSPEKWPVGIAESVGDRIAILEVLVISLLFCLCEGNS